MVKKKIPAAQKGQRTIAEAEGALFLDDIFRLNKKTHEDHEERLIGIKEMKGIGQTPTNQFPHPLMFSMLFMVKSVSEIDPLLFYHQRTLQHLSMDRPDILSKYSDEEELHRSEEEEANDQRSGTNWEIIPKEDLVH